MMTIILSVIVILQLIAGAILWYHYTRAEDLLLFRWSERCRYRSMYYSSIRDRVALLNRLEEAVRKLKGNNQHILDDIEATRVSLQGIIAAMDSI